MYSARTNVMANRPAQPKAVESKAEPQGGSPGPRGGRRRWTAELPEESEEWIISYMDMVTLMLCAFVVIAALLDAGQRPGTALLPTQLPATFAAQAAPIAPPFPPMGESSIPEIEVGSQPAEGPGSAPASIEARAAAPATLESRGIVAVPTGASNVQAAGTGVRVSTSEANGSDKSADAEAAWRAIIAAQGLENRVSISIKDRSVTMEIQDRILFPTGQAELGREGLDVIRKLAPILRAPQGDIRVEGHTDNVPIDTYRFPSNWELSAARAATVVRALIEAGVTPDRLRAIGYADTKPVQSNADDAGRARNRRVSLVIEQ